MKSLLIPVALLLAGQAWAQTTPAGLWRTIDDDGKTEKSAVRIVDNGGVFAGRIERITDPTKQSEVCEKCTDDRKGKPVLGLEILRGVRRNAESPDVWDGGEITDPTNGKAYRVRLKPLEGGKQLQVRGYIGPFYRTQVWQRAE